jgi:cell division protein FtsX
LVLGLVSGAAILGLRATRSWVTTVGQGVHVIAFLRDEMESDQVSQLVDLLQRRPGVARVRLVEPAESLARLRNSARALPATGAWLDDLEPGYFPRSIEVALVASGDLAERASELSQRLRELTGVAGVDAMTDGVARLSAWVRFGQRLGWAVVLTASLAALSFLVSTVLRGREARRRQAQVLVVLGETAGNIRLPANIALATAGLTGTLAALAVLRLAWPTLLVAVERALGIAPTPVGFFLGLGESAAGLAAALVLGWVLGYLSTPVPGWVDA